jgi:hypothetical protein
VQVQEVVAEAVTVGFSPPDALAELAAQLRLRGPVLADPDRVLYRLLGLERAPPWRVYSPATLAWYARSLVRGRRPQRSAEDVRQLGGDALAVDGVVVRRWRPRTPVDRVTPAVLAAAVSGCR